jgi:hypothetical protein
MNVDVDTLKEQLEEWETKGLDPNEHCGMYELVRKTALAYYEAMPSRLSLDDPDLFLCLSTICTFKKKFEKLQLCSLDDSSKQTLLNLAKKIEEKVNNGKYDNDKNDKSGLFNPSVRTFRRGNGVPEDQVQPLIKMFADVAHMSEDRKTEEELVDRADEVLCKTIKGFKNASASQILHCINPFAFPVVNKHQERGYLSLYIELGVDFGVGKTHLNDTCHYRDICGKIRSFRDQKYPGIKNYRIFDLVEFDMPQVKKKANVDPTLGYGRDEMYRSVRELKKKIEALDPVKDRLERVNLFEILRITKTEIRHSNMLAWLLDPQQNHGLEAAFLEKVLLRFLLNGQKLVNKLVDSGAIKKARIKREEDHVDLIIIFDEVPNGSPVVVAIENKTQSAEHDNQLEKYRGIIEKKYTDYDAHFAYLTPEGDESSDPENWLSVSYKDLIDDLEDVPKEKRENVPDDAKVLIDHFIESVRHNLLGEDNLEAICKDVYSEHRLALDTLFKYRPDSEQETSLIEALDLYCDEEVSGKCDLKFYDRSGNEVPQDDIISEPFMNIDRCEINGRKAIDDVVNKFEKAVDSLSDQEDDAGDHVALQVKRVLNDTPVSSEYSFDLVRVRQDY